MDKKTIAGTLAGLTLGAVGGTLATPTTYDIPILDRDDVRIQVLINQDGFHDAIYLNKEEALTKTDTDIETLKTNKINVQMARIEEMSKQITPDEELN